MLSPAICYEEFEERYSQEVATLIPEQPMPPKVLIRMEKAWRGHSVAIIVPVEQVAKARGLPPLPLAA